LDSIESTFEVDRYVISMVLAEWQEQLKFGLDKRGNHTSFGNIPDSLRVA